MYSLLSGLYKYLTRKEEYYVLVLGLDNAGKTVRLNSHRMVTADAAGEDQEPVLGRARSPARKDYAHRRTQQYAQYHSPHLWQSGKLISA